MWGPYIHVRSLQWASEKCTPLHTRGNGRRRSCKGLWVRSRTSLRFLLQCLPTLGHHLHRRLSPLVWIQHGIAVLFTWHSLSSFLVVDCCWIWSSFMTLVVLEWTLSRVSLFWIGVSVFTVNYWCMIDLSLYDLECRAINVCRILVCNCSFC